MFNSIRWKMAAYLAKKAVEETEKGGFKNIKKGLKYFKMSIQIAPPDKELNEHIKTGINEIVSKYSEQGNESC